MLNGTTSRSWRRLLSKPRGKFASVPTPLIRATRSSFCLPHSPLRPVIQLSEFFGSQQVGAATADASGGIHVGANMEAIDYTSTIHAEQHAMNVLRLATDESAVALAFCVVSSAPTTHIAPCGLCRQRIREFAHNVHIPIIACNLAGDEGEIVSLDRYTLDEILPFSFGPDDSSDFTALPQRPAISPVKPFRPSKK